MTLFEVLASAGVLCKQIYNLEKYISETIRCVQRQTYKNWELILIDDCSQDGSYKYRMSF